jgi:hypothetical protein
MRGVAMPMTVVMDVSKGRSPLELASYYDTDEP